MKSKEKQGMITECSLKKDIQADTSGFRNIPIQKVGVKNIKVPFTLLSKDGSDGFRTIATIQSTCSLDEGVKGINMSRISRTINKADIDVTKIVAVLRFIMKIPYNKSSRIAH